MSRNRSVRACCVGGTLTDVCIQLVLGTLSDANAGEIATYFYDMPVASKRRNRHIYPSSKAGDLRIHSLFDTVIKFGFPNGRGSFVYPRKPRLGFKLSDNVLIRLTAEATDIALTTYIVADLNSEAGQALVREALAASVRLPRHRAERCADTCFCRHPSSHHASHSYTTLPRDPLSASFTHRYPRSSHS